MSDTEGDAAERNLGRLVSCWAEGLHPEGLDRARRKFLQAASLREPDAGPAPGTRLGGFLTIAAALLACAAFLSLIVSFPSTPGVEPGPPPARPQEDPESEARRLRQLVEDLASDTFATWDRAEDGLLIAGRSAAPFLERAVDREDYRNRERARNLLDRLTGRTEDVCLACLVWLARHQDPDGSWSPDGFDRQCDGPKCSGPGETHHAVGLTALSLLAFSGAGYSHISKDKYVYGENPRRLLKFGDVVRRALKWLMARQDAEGCVGGRGPKYMYDHALAALALSEAYGLTGSNLFKDQAQKAIDFLVAAQNPGKGWRYSARSGDTDSSVTGWAALALFSAEISGLSYPKAAVDGTLNWYQEVTDIRNGFDVGYDGPKVRKNSLPGKNESFDHHPTSAAIALCARIFLKKDRSDPALGAADLLLRDLPEWKPNAIDFYYWHWASIALFQYDGPSGPRWKGWNETMKNALVRNQRGAKDGCRNGSWDPEVDRWGSVGGRVYATAINALTVEVYYRYANVFGTK